MVKHSLDAEIQRKSRWLQENLFVPEPPFSFLCGGQPSKTFLPGWSQQLVTTELDAARTQHLLTCENAAVGLQVRCLAVEYRDYPVIEWSN